MPHALPKIPKLHVQPFLAFLSLLALAAPTSLSATAPAAPTLEQGFASPPESTKPWCYWYWLSGHITREGITKDLEAMKHAGIGRAIIGDISRPDIARGPVDDLSENYFSMLEHAVREGVRIGVDIALFNCPGWSQTGGPWIKPEQSMRHLVTTERRVTGPARFAEKLPSPAPFSKNPRSPDPRDAMQDVAVLAFPAPAGDCDTIVKHSPRITFTPAIPRAEKLFDGDTATGATFAPPVRKSNADNTTRLTCDIEVDEPFTARSLIIHPPSWTLEPERYKGGAFDADCELLARQPDGSFASIRTFEYRRVSFSEATGPNPRGQVCVSFPATTARHFRLVFSRITIPKSRFNETTLAEIELSAAPRIDNFVEQQLGKMCPQIQPPWDHYLWPAQAEPDAAPGGQPHFAIDPAHTLDLTGQLAPDGTLTWRVPAGDWLIVRVMMRPTGVKNRPASKDGTGLEADKMSPAHAAAHYQNYVGKLISRIPPAERPALKGFIVDSYETGSQNWTDDARERFAKKFGYDPAPWLPALTGRIVGGAAQSTRFLWDLRRFVADTMAETYATYRKLGNADGLQFWLEPYGHYGFPSEYLLLGGAADGLGGEFWLNPKHGQMEVRAALSAAHIYGKNIVSAESFTGTPSYNFTQDPWSLKALGDFQQTEGVNHFVLHVYIHQPSERAPGMNSWFGTEFNRHNTWFANGKAWVDYLRRSHFLLQQGRYAADVAYFIGEDAPKMAGVREPALPDGYLADDINADVICNRLAVRDGRLTLPDGMSYALLVLPPLDTMRPETLAKIRDLVAAGGAILGAPPVRSPSLQNFPDADQSVKKIAAELWGGPGNAGHQPGTSAPYANERRFGKGRVFRGMSTQDALARLGITPNITGLARVEKLWTDLDGQSFPWTHRRLADADIFHISNQLDRAATVAPSFRVTGKQPELWNPVTGEHRALPDFREENGRTIVPLEFAARESLFIVFKKQIHARAGKSGAGGNFPRFRTLAEITTPWTVGFDGTRGGPTPPVTFAALADWLQRPEPEIRNYSGTAVYKNTFELPSAESASATARAPGEKIHLDLGTVASLARVKLNGRDLGVVWCAPWRIDITAAAKTGVNQLEIAVTNTWINRLLADRELPETRHVTWTASDHIRAQKPQTSGLLGPVKIESSDF